jgi:GntR family transcriptional regulator, trigonelline degradation regulator
LFAQRATEADRRALRTALIHVEAAVDDMRQLLAAKVEFYDALISGTQNTELKQFLEAKTRRVTAVRAVSLSKPGRPKESVAEVQAICAAAVPGDADLAERLCREHVEHAAAAALPLLNG